MEELIKNFGVNWKLLLAQFINFAVLFILVRKFAYKPIMEILRKRREGVEKGIKFTEEAEQTLKNIDEKKKQALEYAKSKAFQIVTEGQNISKKSKEDALKEAAKKAELIIEDARRAAKEEAVKMKDVIYRESEELIKAGIEKVLLEKTDQIDGKLVRSALAELAAVNK